VGGGSKPVGWLALATWAGWSGVQVGRFRDSGRLFDWLMSQARESQQLSCGNVARRLEESVVRLAGARYEARDSARLLRDCGDRLAEAQRELNASQRKLNSDEVSRGKLDDRDGNVVGQPAAADGGA